MEKMRHPHCLPSLVFVDSAGNIRDFPELGMMGGSGGHFLPPELHNIIPLPIGSEIFTLPKRMPIGWDISHREPVLLAENPFPEENKNIAAAAAFVAPAYTSLFYSAYQSKSNAPPLPLFAYSAVGWLDGEFWVTAFRSDGDIRQDLDQYQREDVEEKTVKKKKLYKNNRLVQHLGKCCLSYGCPAARNYFLGRWEAPLPTSPVCNARCLGCISLQDSGICAAQDRINFVPTVEELCEVAIPHLKKAKKAIVSFGQGCEGEPLLQTEVIEKSIVLMRQETARGTINLNSNASLPQKVKRLAKVGLDSIRVSINSAQEKCYNAYYRPKNYEFSDVLRSIDVMKEGGRHVSLNYFILAGFTDSNAEFDALCRLISLHKPDFIQLRNLNIDPEWYLRAVCSDEKCEVTDGLLFWLGQLKAEFPKLQFGYFNPEVRSKQKKS